MKRKMNQGILTLACLLWSPRAFGCAAHVIRGGEGDGDDPKGAGELHGGTDLKSLGAVFCACSDDGGGVVDGEGAPEAELILGEVEQVAEEGEEEESYGVEDEDDAHGDGDFFFVGIGYGGERGDGGASADGGAHGDEERGFAADFEDAAQEQAEGGGGRDGDGGVQEARGARVEDGLKVHAEAEQNDGDLEEKLGEGRGFLFVGVLREEAEEDAKQKRRWAGRQIRRR